VLSIDCRPLAVQGPQKEERTNNPQRSELTLQASGVTVDEQGVVVVLIYPDEYVLVALANN